MRTSCVNAPKPPQTADTVRVHEWDNLKRKSKWPAVGVQRLCGRARPDHSCPTEIAVAVDRAQPLPRVPATLVGTFPQIAPLNIMFLKSPASAILSAVIFNAVIIIALIPLALHGVRFRPLGAAKILARNLLIYGLGGIIMPFIGIKLIDMLITTIGLA
jgi:high-affinity K+ transport system ATPase subunit B